MKNNEHKTVKYLHDSNPSCVSQEPNFAKKELLSGNKIEFFTN